MCNEHSTAIVRLHHPRLDGIAIVGVDPCIASLVQAFNDAGIQTIASCCGHGHQPASIVLEDFREIRVCTFDQARAFDRLFPNIVGER